MKLQIHICLCFLKGNDKLQFFLKGYKYKEEKMGIEGRLFIIVTYSFTGVFLYRLGAGKQLKKIFFLKCDGILLV